MSKLTQLLCLLLIPLTSACLPVPIEIMNRASETERILIKGDPMTFIRGTIQDTTSGIPMEITEGKNYAIRVAVFVTEKQTTYQEAIADQTPVDAPSSGSVSSPNQYKLRKLTANTYRMESNEKTAWEVTLKNNNGKLTPTQLGNYSQKRQGMIRFPVEVQHYSVAANKKSFSLLLKGTDKDGTFLANVVFIENEEKTTLEILKDSAYNYLWGTGVKIRWTRPLHIKKCLVAGYSSRMYEDSVESLEPWQEVLKGKLAITMSSTYSNCVPFSDLNSQNIYHITDWVEIQGSASINAFAMTHANVDHGEMIDGDIFFLEREWEESYRRKVSDMSSFQFSGFQKRYQRTMTHEIGHILGLHHQFDIPSIMDYRGTNYLTSYDRNAIETLYTDNRTEEESETTETASLNLPSMVTVVETNELFNPAQVLSAQ